MRNLGILLLAGCASSSLGYVQPPPSSNGAVGLGSIHGRLAVALETAYRATRAQPPVSLVPSDGSELVLTKLVADVAITGPIAHTELRFSFKNTEERQREGRFAVTLPPGAAVTRFAMKIHGEWREARVVSRERGREVYETFLHRNIDPALLEQDLGNIFSARVFPIAALEDKELILAYDHEVSSAYSLALSGLPKVGELVVRVDNNGKHDTTTLKDEMPHDLTYTIPEGTDAVATGEAFVVRVDDMVTSDRDAPLDRVLYLVDTSASRAPVMAKQTALLEALLAANPHGTVAIATFDHTTVELYRGLAMHAGHALPNILYHGALGTSNLGAALERATTMGMDRVVIIGDGVPTAGEHEAEKLAAIVRGSQIQRVDAVQVGQHLDRTVLEPLVRAGKRPGAIVDGSQPQRTTRQLSSAIAPPVAIEVDGVTESWPKTTANLAPGDPLFVFGLRTGDGPIVVRVGARSANVDPRAGHARLRRAVARAELAALIAQPQTLALGAKIEKLALAHELVSPRTSLIVLESDADEQRMLGSRDITQPAPFLHHIPTGRTFRAVLGRAAGSQTDGFGISLAGASSLENLYIVDGVNTTGLQFGSTSGVVRADVMSALAFDQAANAMRHSAFLFGDQLDDFHRPSPPKRNPPYTGRFEKVMKQIAARDPYALLTAHDWHLESPGDVAAIIALGEALEASGAGALAARAYASIADLYPNRAELLRAAGERLDRIGARALAIDCYRRALRERPDQMFTSRLLAWSLFRANRPEEALEAIEASLKLGRRAEVDRVLMDDAAIITANIVARHPERRYAMKFPIAVGSTLRFVLAWETDVTDVDLHVRDKDGNRSTPKSGALASGGNTLRDMTDGFGPESFVIQNPKAFPYKLSAHYAAKGPMGIGLGTVQVIRHDGYGGVVVEDRPFLIQNDNAVVELGVVTAR
jgi:tetratricopeptide (TPR) repeat protein